MPNEAVLQLYLWSQGLQWSGISRQTYGFLRVLFPHMVPYAMFGMLHGGVDKVPSNSSGAWLPGRNIMQKTLQAFRGLHKN